MKEHHIIIIGASAVAIILALFLSTFIASGEGPVTATGLVGDTPAPILLEEHSDEFRREVIKVTDGIYVAVGYAIANAIMIEAPEGLIIIDVTESIQAGQEIFAAFRNISKAPVKAIIYTHNHGDHMYGAPAFIEEGSKPEIWAYKDLPYLIAATATVLPLTHLRATRQFGVLLNKVVPSAFKNAGIGNALRINKENMAALILPTHFLREEREDVTLAGLALTLVHIPGETMDQMGVWIPSKKAFFCGDDVYKAFPNLYAIRGTPARDTTFWANSVDKMIDYEPEFLVGSHARPLTGKDYIKSVLIPYRDAILFVHDQTVRFMNKGMFPDDIVAKVKLPKHLEEHPYLIPYYGQVEWSVRSVFDRYMGWFSGNIVDLSRHTTLERAKRMVEMGGGKAKMMESAQKALEDKDYRWSLEVATYLITVYPDEGEAMKIRLESLKALASQQVSSNGRNYYLSTALEDYKFLDISMSKEMKKAAIMLMNPRNLFEMLSLTLKAEEIENVDQILVVHLTDLKEVYSLHIRNSVLNIKNGVLDRWNVKVSSPFQKWKQALTDVTSLQRSGDFIVEGGQSAFTKFLSYFEI